MSFQVKFEEFLNGDPIANDPMPDQLSPAPYRVDYAERCARLVNRCDQIRADNQRLIHNIYKMKRLTKKLIGHKKYGSCLIPPLMPIFYRILMKRLDKHRDNYKNSDFPLFLEAIDHLWTSFKLIAVFAHRMTQLWSWPSKPSPRAPPLSQLRITIQFRQRAKSLNLIAAEVSPQWWQPMEPFVLLRRNR